MTDGQARCLIVGGDQLLREGLQRVLSGVVDVVDMFDTLIHGMNGRSEPPAVDIVLLLEWHPGDLQFLECLRRLRSGSPKRRVVILGRDLDAWSIRVALKEGVDGYLVRDFGAPALLHSLHLVLLGEGVFPRRVVQQLLQGGVENGGLSRHGEMPVLSNRQTEILERIANGQSNKEIARGLGTSEATVKVHVRSVLRKIGVENRTQAAIWAHAHGVGQGELTPRPSAAAAPV
ncbi:response regulator transcription factor [Inquilinus sp. CAU 1745]|uniref:response regulator transcription factor n=1 Tax=Inquilinus sp. CAU 1745 TaxID=3140369 RepID=UPI00325BABA8